MKNCISIFDFFLFHLNALTAINQLWLLQILRPLQSVSMSWKRYRKWFNLSEGNHQSRAIDISAALKIDKTNIFGVTYRIIAKKNLHSSMQQCEMTDLGAVQKTGTRTTNMVQYPFQCVM